MRQRSLQRLHTYQTEGRPGGRSFTKQFLDALDHPKSPEPRWPWWNTPAYVRYLRQHPQIGPDIVAALLAVYAYREPEPTEEDVAWRLHLSMVSLEAWQRRCQRLLLRKERYEEATVHPDRTPPLPLPDAS